MLVECNVEAPPGHRIIKYDYPELCDVYFKGFGTLLHQCHVKGIAGKVFILEKILTLNDLNVGDKFLFNPVYNPDVPPGIRFLVVDASEFYTYEDFRVVVNLSTSTLIAYSVERPVVKC